VHLCLSSKKAFAEDKTMTIAKLLSSLSLCAVIMGAPVYAQEVARLIPDASFPEGFSFLSGIRELPDSRVLVADPIGQVFMRLDMRRGTADTLGRVGRGPREYIQPDQVFPLPGDSTLLVDLGNARLTVVGPDGSLGRTMPMTQGDPSSGGNFTSIMPRFTDGSGRIYFEPSLLVTPGGAITDSAPVSRFDQASGRIDTVATVKSQERESQNSRQGGGMAMMVRPIPLSPQDDWAVSADGRVAVVRASDYHVDWVGPDGGVTSGSPHDVSPVRIRRPEQEQWIEQEAAAGLNFNWNNNNGQIDITYMRGLGRGRRADPSRFEWPDEMPPFRAGRTLVSPAGDVWVERSVAAGSATTIDVFDSAGLHKGSITLKPGHHVVGFGAETVYVTHADEYDLIWLERFRISYDL
jgi:hypothetical protein